MHAGLEALVSEKPDIVLIHDAARPLVGEEVIEEAFRTAQEVGGALPCVAEPATLKRRGADGRWANGLGGDRARSHADIRGPVHLRPIDADSNVANSVAIRIQYALTYRPGNLTITDGTLADSYIQVTLVNTDAL